MALSEYQGMWSIVMFDLPVGSTRQRRAYARFRNLLLQSGYMQLQYSVYARYHGSEKQSDPLCNEIKSSIPQDGYVRILKVTDRQFGKMENFFGENPVESENVDEQFLLF